jgi:hypothetical protein
MTYSDSQKPMDRAEISKFALLYEGFDPALARKLAELIQQAYRQFHLKQAPQLDGYQVTPLGTEKIPFGFVAYETSSNNIFVIFRGTMKFIEWFKDANIQLVSYKDSTIKNHQTREKVEIKGEIADGVIQENQSSVIIDNIDNDFGYVTAGFRGIYVSLRQQLIQALKGRSQDSRIFVTGHSLGGALATLAVPDILKNTHFNNPEKIVLYTFASPRCGDRKFAISFQKTRIKHWRIANTEDFVTMLPFPTGNVLRTESPEIPPEPELGYGGVTGVDTNPNPLFGFFKEIYNRRKRRMPDYVHVGTPIYFTIHEAALERHHNLNEIYMIGISQPPIKITG